MILLIFSISSSPIVVKAESSTRYAKETINIRAKPNTKSKIVGKLYWNDKVQIIKKVSKKWYMIRYKKKKRYVCASFLKNRKSKYKVCSSPSKNTFKSYEDANCITDSTKLAQGRLKRGYHLDYHSGVWMVGNRYCIAVGSYYTKRIGVKIDLVLSPKSGRKHTLKCITADCKSDRDTVNMHRIHKDGSVVEFIVKTKYLSKRTKLTGDISCAGKKFKGKIKEIRVYK